MLVVVASNADDEARTLIRGWSREVVLLTVSDLSRSGWVCDFPSAGPSFVANGERHSTRDIEGVLVRLAAVRPAELPHFGEADRLYAAAEMTAFLAFWLTALPCPVINRPSPSYLLGPAWTREQWLTVAAQQGLATVALDAAGGATSQALEVSWVTVAGDTAVGGTSDRQCAAFALRDLAGVSALSAGFVVLADGERLAAVSLLPDLRDVQVRDAIFNALVEGVC